ncbi:MAG: hypothetical protein AB7N80_08270 [Bdellovibrionales bacterium]
MKKVAYVGCGLLAVQMKQFLKEKYGDNNVDDCGFDQNPAVAAPFRTYPFSELMNEKFSDRDFYVCFGYHHLQKKTDLIKELKAAGRSVPAFVHHSTYVSPTAVIGDGCIVFPGCNLDQDVIIGVGVLLHNSVVVSHNTIIGMGSYLAPGVTLSGDVEVGAMSFLGTGTAVSNGVHIGKQVRVGIGSVVTENLKDGASAVGNPIKILADNLNLK